MWILFVFSHEWNNRIEYSIVGDERRKENYFILFVREGIVITKQPIIMIITFFDGGGGRKVGQNNNNNNKFIFSFHFIIIYYIEFTFPFWLTPCYYQSINQSITSLETKKRCLFVFHHEIRLSDLLITCCLDPVFCFVFGFVIWDLMNFLFHFQLLLLFH